MSDDPATELAKEIAKVLPIKEVYNDLLSPAAKQVGGALEDTVKAVRFALLPIEALGAYRERASKFIHRAIDKVPEERRVPPPPQILGPIIEAIKYEPDGTDISEMFNELLTKAFDKERQGFTHPSYPVIIRQLSSDEARILKRLTNVAEDEVHLTYPTLRSPGQQPEYSSSFSVEGLIFLRTCSFTCFASKRWVFDPPSTLKIAVVKMRISVIGNFG